MTDLHTHILPCIDDGSSSLEESLALLAMLGEQGVEDVVLTPHYYGQRRSVGQFLERRDAAYARLTEAYEGGIRFRRASECNISTCANSDFSELRPVAIEGTEYILTEMSFEKDWDGGLWKRLADLRDYAGLRPVIAHVEVYPAVQRKPEYAYRLIDEGCLLQMNCDSAADMTKNSLAYALLSHGQIHCLGSDTHNTSTRPPRYGEAAEKIRAEFGTETLAGLQENMSAILANERVAAARGTAVKRKLLGGYA